VSEETTAVRNLLAAGWSVSGGEIFRLNAPSGIRITTAALNVEEAPLLADAIAAALGSDGGNVRY
jgi:hypothetical protein